MKKSLQPFRTAGLGTVVDIAPSTAGFTDAQALAGWTLQQSVLNGPPGQRRYFVGSNAYEGGSVWVGYITGTDATLSVDGDFGSLAPGMVEVSIDAGAVFAAANVGTTFTLFSGLPHARRFVVIRFKSNYGDTVFIQRTGTVFSVAGKPPALQPLSGWRLAGDGTTDSRHTHCIANVGHAANFTPGKVCFATDFTLGAPTSIVRGNYSEMTIVTAGRYIGVSVDGATRTIYDRGTTELGAYTIKGLSGVHTYYVFSNPSPFWSIGGQVTAQSAPASMKAMDHYGHSIVKGYAATSFIHTDLFRWAPALGYIPANFGLNGDHMSTLKDRILTILSTGKTIKPGDVALLDVGRNDVGGPFDATQTADYRTCITRLLDAGYSKVVCSGILPEGANVYPAENGSIASIVSGLADPRVLFSDPSSFSGIALADDRHPTDAGYATLAGYRLTAMRALGL